VFFIVTIVRVICLSVEVGCLNAAVAIHEEAYRMSMKVWPKFEDDGDSDDDDGEEEAGKAAEEDSQQQLATEGFEDGSQQHLANEGAGSQQQLAAKDGTQQQLAKEGSKVAFAEPDPEPARAPSLRPSLRKSKLIAGQLTHASNVTAAAASVFADVSFKFIIVSFLLAVDSCMVGVIAMNWFPVKEGITVDRDGEKWFQT
jgi:hypothetical protein